MIVRQVELCCDWCGDTAPYTDNTATEARRINAEVGWKHEGRGVDVCPECDRKRKEKG